MSKDILIVLIRRMEMRQACVRFECISNNDNPFNNFYMQALSKERVPVLDIIAAQRDNITCWKFTSWCRR